MCDVASGDQWPPFDHNPTNPSLYTRKRPEPRIEVSVSEVVNRRPFWRNDCSAEHRSKILNLKSCDSDSDDMNLDP